MKSMIKLWRGNCPDEAGPNRWNARWIWRRGKLTADGVADREFLYLHFSHWQSDRWTPDGRAAWKTLERLDNCPPGSLQAFEVSAAGFSPARSDAAMFRHVPQARVAGARG